MEGKRREEEEMQDRLVVEEGIIVQFTLVPSAICLLPLQLLLQGSFQHEELIQPHWRDTQRPNILKYVVPPEAPDHLPLTTLPCLPEPCSYCGKNFSRKSSLYEHMLFDCQIADRQGDIAMNPHDPTLIPLPLARRSLVPARPTARKQPSWPAPGPPPLPAPGAASCWPPGLPSCPSC